MASHLPTRRLARNLRTENVIPQDKDKDAGRQFGRAKSDSKLAMPSAAGSKSRLLAPTASSKAKSIAPETKGEKRKREGREALAERADKNILEPSKSAILNPRKTAPKPLSAVIRARTTLLPQRQPTKPTLQPYHASDDSDHRMQVCEEQQCPPPMPVERVHEGQFDDAHNDQGQFDDADEEPAPKRHHTSSPASQQVEDMESRLEAEEVARDLHVLVEEDEEDHALQDWDDLDAEDWDDPGAVTEYVVEISEYLMNMEASVLPDPNYIDAQPEFTWTDRREVLNWCFSVHAAFQLQNETWFLTVNIFDRFLCTRQIHSGKLQLVSLVCLFVASKFEETYVPQVQQMVMQLCTEEQLANKRAMAKVTTNFMAAERYVLQTLGWDLKYPSPMGWLRRGSKADNSDQRVRLLGKYLMDIASLDWRQVGCRPSLLAASALWVGRLMLCKSEWTANLRHYTTYTEEQMMGTTKHIIDALLRPRHHYPSVFSKYASKKHSKASIFCREWATTRWRPNSNVDIAQDLPEIKRDIDLRNEARRVRKAEALRHDDLYDGAVEEI